MRSRQSLRISILFLHLLVSCWGLMLAYGDLNMKKAERLPSMSGRFSSRVQRNSHHVIEKKAPCCQTEEESFPSVLRRF